MLLQPDKGILRDLGINCTNALIILSFRMSLAVEIIKKCWLTGHKRDQSESSESKQKL